MSKQLVFYDSFLVSNIMCFEGCGVTLKSYLQGSIDELKEKKNLPADTSLIVDAEPHGLGLHQIHVSLESKENLKLDSKLIADKLQKDQPFPIVANGEPEKAGSRFTNWINIFLNLGALILIILLACIFPPSLPLVIGLVSISIFTTLITAREAFKKFIYNFKHKSFANMGTSVTLGWTLATAHTLYHAITMPLMMGFSMIFMTFMMPIILIMIINLMDEIKRLILKKSATMQLMGMKGLFPELVDDYVCYESEILLEDLHTEPNSVFLIEESKIKLSAYSLACKENASPKTFKKKLLKKGLIIKVQEGECFPVDGYIVDGETIIDASILTGEPKQAKKHYDFVPAGAVNLGKTVYIYALTDTYSSKMNKLLFRANRANQEKALKKERRFMYLYLALIILSLVVVVILPFILKVFSLAFMLQNLLSIVFSVCFCTLSIANEAPKLFSLYQRHQHGIVIRSKRLIDNKAKIHTIVFDKTGTLTTGNSKVDSSEGISQGLWQRIYLLEKELGFSHPLARAIIHYAEAKMGKILMKDLASPSYDPANRGISAVVQGLKVHLGSLAYLKEAGINNLPNPDIPPISEKLEQGQTAVYIAEDWNYKGVMFIKHEIKPEILKSLKALKDKNLKLIMLTGDTGASAKGFNKQIGSIFSEENIHAGQTPENKEQFLSTLMDGTANEGIWFIGDGLNDAPSARIVSEKGGVSCSLANTDKSAAFTDLSLDGSLDYLFFHEKLNRFQKKTVEINQGIIIFSALCLLSLVLSFAFLGLVLSPLIAMTLMVTTTILTLYNSYRVNPFSANLLEPHKGSWLKKFIASNWSLALAILASMILITAAIMTTIVSGGILLPLIAAVVSLYATYCFIAGGVLFSLFAAFNLAYLIEDNLFSENKKPDLVQGKIKGLITKPEPYIYKKGFKKIPSLEEDLDSLPLEVMVDSPSP